ncbi:hypothetical protein MY11210_003546 [Beauveria gryllotalpidicola]
MVMTTPTFDRHDWYISREVDGEQKEILDSMSMGMSMVPCGTESDESSTRSPTLFDDAPSTWLGAWDSAGAPASQVARVLG